MAEGCTNPNAVNFDGAADSDDGSCKYLASIGGNCYLFTDYNVANVKSQGFTMSYSVAKNNWVFFHDYIPDFYFHTREKMHLIQDKNIFTANSGLPGFYLPTTASLDAVAPNGKFFIDVVFNYKDEAILDSINWVMEVLDRADNNTLLEFNPLTHITIWNSFQTSGRIPLTALENTYQVENTRKTKSTWMFNDFRDLVASRNGANFLLDIFNNFAVNTGALDPNMPWYERKLFEDHYFIVRFEFDNGEGHTEDVLTNVNKTVYLHDTDADVTPSAR